MAVSCNPDEKKDNEVPAAPASLSVAKPILDAEEGSTFVSVVASGAWTLTLDFEDGKDWASVSPASGNGNKGNVRLSYDENTSGSARTVTLVLRPEKGEACTAKVKQLSEGGSAGVESLGYGLDVTHVDWLEIPKTVEGDGREFFTHSMDGGRYVSASKSGVRNWSFYWDYDDHLSLWVAYPLNNKLRGSGSRTNEWGWDPILPHDLQPELINGSYGGGWTRGHQIPSADRLSKDANISTFVPTNMTPQDYDFNCDIWAGLEQKVRDYSTSADTLYVVTGCLFDSSSRRTGNRSGFVVKVPTHYFKALLYRGSSTYATSGFMAAGFFLPHESSIALDNFLNYIMSIDELEAKTGIDFFPNLASVVGADKADKIEAETPSKWWK